MPPKITRFEENDEPIEGYVLVDFLGRGQFGEVWKARDKASGKLVAIKIIDLAFSPTALKELRAFKLVKNLNHPNLIPIFTARLKNRRDKEVDFDKADALPKGDLKELVIAMGLGEKSLSHRLKELNPDGTYPDARKGIPVAELIRYFKGAAKGIDFLNQTDHGLGAGDGPIVHCDIKPENLMIVAGEVQVADCGVAVIISPDMRQTRAAGSPAYSAPELSGNKPVPGTDQYALAISYYELRTGRLPFPDEASLQQIILAHALGDLDLSSPVLSDAEREVLRRATARVPADRFETCEEFVEELAALPEIKSQLRGGRRGHPSSPSFNPEPGRQSGGSIDLIDLARGSDHVGKGSGPTATPTGPAPARPAAPPPPPPAARGTPPGPSWREVALPPSGKPPASPPAPAPQRPAAELPPPPRHSGTINFNEFEIPPEVRGPEETGAPTPWLPVPAPRPVPPEPPAKSSRGSGTDYQLPAAEGPLPTLAPEPPAPAAGPRDTMLPFTETPRATPAEAAAAGEAPPAPAKGGIGMPVDPGDPLGRRYATAVPDEEIQKIISESQRIAVPQSRVLPPPPPPAAPPKPAAPKAPPKAPEVKQPAPKSPPPPARPKSAPVVPPPAAAPEPPAKPEWFKEAVAEEARRKSGPVPGTKSQPVAPPPAAPPEPESKPEWFKEGQREQREQAKRASAPVGNWKDGGATAAPPSGGKGKLIAALAAGGVGIAALGVGGWMIIGPSKPPSPTAVNGGGGGAKPGFDETAARNELQKLLGKANLTGADLSAAESLIAEKQKADPPAPATWRDWAREELGKATQVVKRNEHVAPLEAVLAVPTPTEADVKKARRLIEDLLTGEYAGLKPEYAKRVEGLEASLGDRGFTTAWAKVAQTIDAGADPQSIVKAVRDTLTGWSTDKDRQLQLARNVVAKYEAKHGMVTPPRGWGEVGEALRTLAPFDKLTDAERRTVARWRAADLYADLPGQLAEFQKLAPAKAADFGAAPPNRTAAREAVGKWLQAAAAAKADYGPAWPAEDPRSNPQPVAVQRWYEATAEKAGGAAVEGLRELVTRPEGPSVVADLPVLALEYYRLAGPTEPVASLRQVRNNARDRWGGLSESQKGVIDAAFQWKLGEWVKAALSKDPTDYTQISTQVEQDPANGWVAAAAAEAKLAKGQPGPAEDLTRAEAAKPPAGDPELGRYLSFLRGWVAGVERKHQVAARAVAAAYPPKATHSVLDVAFRKMKAATVLAEAAAGAAAPAASSGEELFAVSTGWSDPTAARDWLATAVRLDPTPDGFRHALLAIAAKAAGDAGGVSAARAGLRWPLDRRLSPDQRLAVALAVADPRAGSFQGADLPAVAEIARTGAERIEQLLARTTADAARERIRNEFTVELDKSVIKKGLQIDGAAAANPEQSRAALLLARGRLYAAYNTVKGLGSREKPLEKLQDACRDLDAAVRAAAGDKQLEAECRGWNGYARFLTFLYDRELGKNPDSEGAQKEWATAREHGRAAVEGDPQGQIGHQLLAYMMHSELESSHPFALYLTAPKTPRAEREKLFKAKDPWDWTYEEYQAAAPTDRRSGNPTVNFNRAWFCFEYANKKARAEGVGKRVSDILSRGVDDLKLAAEDGYPYPWLVHDLRGCLLEDRAWYSRKPAAADFAEAIAELEKALAAVPAKHPLRDRSLARFNMDLGRTAYRAAVFGPGGDRTRLLDRAKQHLMEAAESKAADAAEYVAEAAYYLGLVHLAQNDPGAGEKALAKAGAEAGGRLYHRVAGYARLALLHASRAADDAEWKEKAAKAVKDVQTLLEESTVADVDDLRFLPDYLQGVIDAADKKPDRAASAFRRAAFTAETRAASGAPGVTDFFYFDALLRQAELHADPAVRPNLKEPLSGEDLRERVQKMNDYRDRFPFFVDPAHRSRLDTLATAVNRIR